MLENQIAQFNRIMDHRVLDNPAVVAHGKYKVTETIKPHVKQSNAFRIHT